MVITVDIIREKFDEYNKLYFNRELPRPEFRLIDSYRTCGYFSCKKLVGKRRMKGQRLEVSRYYDWDEDKLRDVIVHEMIHYYLGFKHIDNELSHGEEFMKMADRFNAEYGLNIGEKISLKGFRKAEDAPGFTWFLMRLFT